MTEYEEILTTLRMTHISKTKVEAERRMRLRHNMATDDLDAVIKRYDMRIAQLNELLNKGVEV